MKLLFLSALSLVSASRVEYYVDNLPLNFNDAIKSCASNNIPNDSCKWQIATFKNQFEFENFQNFERTEIEDFQAFIGGVSYSTNRRWFWLGETTDIDDFLAPFWHKGEPKNEQSKNVLCVRSEDGEIKNCDGDKRYGFVCERRCPNF